MNHGRAPDLGQDQADRRSGRHVGRLAWFDVLTPDRARSSRRGPNALTRRREGTRGVDLHGGRGAECKRDEHAGIIDTDVDRPGWQQTVRGVARRTDT